jgi:hypothetical protein
VANTQIEEEKKQLKDWDSERTIKGLNSNAKFS